MSNRSSDATARRIREMVNERVVVLEQTFKSGRETRLRIAIGARTDSDITVNMGAVGVLKVSALASLMSAIKDRTVGPAFCFVKWQ